MMIHILDYLLSYAGVVIGILIQAFFLLLPVNFKNWEDDTLYVLTYIGIQGLAGAFIFIIFPLLLEIKMLQYNTLFVVIVSICLLAAFRAVKIIPLEFTFPIKAEHKEVPRILFTDFYNAKRYAILAEIPFDLPDAEARYNAFRERILTARAEENESILEELISLESQSDE